MKIGQRLKQIIGTVAPMLGTSLGGPLGGIAGNMLQKALGVDTEEAALQLIDTNPTESLAKLRQAEVEFKKLDIDLERINQQDRDSARQRQVAMKDHTPTVLAFLLTAGFFGTLFWMLKYGLPLEGRDVIMVMIGSLGTAWISAIVYYFGSSSGSAKKTEMLGNANR